jgi:hypothetical protein
MKSIFFILLVCVCNIVYAAPPPPPSGSPACWPPPCVPIDNGIIFLIIAGTLLGLKKIYDFRKKQQVIS